MSKFLININGEFFDEHTAQISVFDRGFLYGDSVYEATRTFKRVPFRIDQHLDRLFDSAQKIDLTPTLTKPEILKRLLDTIRISPHDDIAIRIILSRGTNSDLGLDPNLASSNNLVIISKEIPPNPLWWIKTGLSMVFYQKQSTQKGPLPKSGNYQENILAHNAALLKNAYDAIMVNHEGHVTEGTTSNVWIIKNSILYTPPLSDGVLEGLTRRSLIDMANSEKIIIREKSLTPKEIMDADECFITSTTRNLVPVTSVEDKAIGNGLPGKMTLELLQKYLNFVSKS
jgi:branched-chain amino acid aminotransferase